MQWCDVRSWQKDVAINFIIELPKLEGYNTILSDINRLTKIRYFISYRID